MNNYKQPQRCFMIAFEFLEKIDWMYPCFEENKTSRTYYNHFRYFLVYYELLAAVYSYLLRTKIILSFPITTIFFDFT